MTSIRESTRLLLQPLQRLRPRTPFWNIPAHRVPTLRLYRNLLKEAPTDAIRFCVRLTWKQNKHMTGLKQTCRALRRGYKYLDVFQRANAGDLHCQEILKRYSRFIDIRCEKEYWKYLLQKELVWRAKLRYRPILTGASFPSAISRRPLPRMINLPVKVSQMIRWRHEANKKRVLKYQSYLDTVSDFKAICDAEDLVLRGTLRKNTVFGGRYNDWVQPYQAELGLMKEAFDRATSRAQTPFPQALLDQLKAARRERVLNKTKERARELRGEVTRSLLKKLRRGPPAHVLSKMTPRQRFLDKVARHPSEVGFTAIAKRELKRGFKNPDAWIIEESREKKEVLDAIAQEIRRENQLKRGIKGAHDQDDRYTSLNLSA